jgi:adenine deaminase
MGAKMWNKISRELVEVAMGRDPADMVIRQGRWVSVQSGELIENTDIAMQVTPLAPRPR